MERLNDYSLPEAWRGVASPRYLRLARWLSLVEELGGVRGLGQQHPGSMESILMCSGGKAGNLEMSLFTLASKAEQLDELRRFLTDNLARHERLVLMLYYAERLSFDQIAEVLDLPQATVAGILRKTLAALQQRFG